MRLSYSTPPAPYPHKTIRHPETPVNTSPTPWLTSLHATQQRGPYGRANYRGNCSGYLIKDLIHFFGARRVLDPMTGGGTCRDVCEELNVECVSFDLKEGQDACSKSSYVDLGQFDFVWLHPPYWRQIIYSDDPRCLSNAPTIEAFTKQIGDLLDCSASVLSPNGKIALLMGNYVRRGRFHPLTYLAMNEAIRRGLWPACTDIVRLLYQNTSSRKRYQNSIIPGVHDTCMVLEVDNEKSQTIETGER